MKKSNGSSGGNEWFLTLWIIFVPALSSYLHCKGSKNCRYCRKSTYLKTCLTLWAWTMVTVSHRCIDDYPLHNIKNQCLLLPQLVSESEHLWGDTIYWDRSAQLLWICTLVHIQGETHHSCCQHGKCECLCSWFSSRHIPRTSTSMLSICPVLKRLLGNNYPPSQNTGNDGFTAVFASCNTS